MKIILVVIIIIFSCNNYTQELKFSFHFETSVMKASDRNSARKLLFNPISDMYISAKYNLNSKNAVNGILGYKYSETFNYKGPEFGFYYNRSLFRDLYGLFGVKAFVTTPGKYISHTVSFASFGVGYYIFPLVSVELFYNEPLKEKYYSNTSDLNSYIYNEFNFGIALHAK